MNVITYRQTNVHLIHDTNGYHFSYEGNNYDFSSKAKVHEFFRNKGFDIIKLCQKGKKQYLHLSDCEIEMFDTKKTLRKSLSRDSSGAWIEEKAGKKRCFVDDSGWFNTSYQQVSEKECLLKLDSPSTMQKVLGIGLGILSLAPGISEFLRHAPMSASAPALISMNQRSPALGLLAYGLFQTEVVAQTVGTEFQVNDYTINDQLYPWIASLSEGGFVIVWQSTGQDGSSDGIFGKIFAPNGSNINQEFQVNTHSTDRQIHPVVTGLNDGGFVVAWQSLGQDGDRWGVFAQRYASNGSAFESEFQVNTYITLGQEDPSVAQLKDGSFVIVWESLGPVEAYDIFGQKFDVNSSSVGEEFLINSHTADEQWYPRVAALEDGGFIVTWQSLNQDGDRWGIYGQRFSSNGTAVDTEFQVNTYSPGGQEDTIVTGLKDGGFVITWESFGQDGSGYGIFARRFYPNNSAVGNEFQVNNFTTGNQQYPSIAATNDGGFIITWQSLSQDGSSWGIFGKYFNSNGAPLDSEFQVNTYTPLGQEDPIVATLKDGGTVVTWESNLRDGSGFGISGQRFDKDGNAIELLSPPSNSSIASSSVVNTYTPATLASTPYSSISNPSNFSTHLPSTTQMQRSSPTSPEITQSDSSIPPSNSNISLEVSGNIMHTSSPSGFVIPSLIEIIYGESLPISLNGQTIGTFSISGGAGPYNSNNPNTLNIEIDQDIVLQDGDTVTLFSVPEGEEPQWENITLTNSDACFNAEGELVQNEENTGIDYQIIFRLDNESCSDYAVASRFGAIPVLANGGLL